MKECDIFRGSKLKTYSEPSYKFSGIKTPITHLRPDFFAAPLQALRPPLTAAAGAGTLNATPNQTSLGGRRLEAYRYVGVAERER